MTDTTPLPCPNPWCASHERHLPLTSIGIVEVPIIYGRIGFRPHCIDCGLRGPVVERKADAYPAWNTRANADARLVEALRAVEAAMLRGGDGHILDHGWNITKLNEARPLIRAALSEVSQ